jgi:transcriptional regulator with PAS, ATPase and Fis domain
MRTVLDSIAEGVIVADSFNTLTFINPAAGKILNVSEKDSIGHDTREIIPNTRTHDVLSSGIAELNTVQEMYGKNIITSRVPIMVNGEAVGVVCTFTEEERIEQAARQLRSRLPRRGFSARYRLEHIITREAEMLELKQLAAIYATTSATLMLQGESGTGKELFAQGIHNASKRAGNPFVAVNCGAIPASLLESELFGYEEGAFTGANRKGKAGFFELAHEGTLFLDEVGELPHDMQARLLRVLQEQEIVRVGGTQVIPINLRIICATNQDLGHLSQNGRFRKDLYYRLNVLPLTIPALRERPSDIVYLASHFLRERVDFRTAKLTLSEFEREIGPMLNAYSWPGNVRELGNVVERLALSISMFPKETWFSLLHKVWPEGMALGRKPESADPRAQIAVDCEGSLKDITRRSEQEIIKNLLERHGQDHGRVARLLGISRMSLWRKLKNGASGAGDSD